MAIIFLNNFSTVTVNPLAPADTTLEIQDGIADIAAALTGGNTLVLTLFSADDQGNETQREIIHATAADEVAGTLTIERAQEGTAAGTWAPNTGVEQRLTAGALDEALSTPGYAVSGAAAVGEGAEATSAGSFAAMGGAYGVNAVAIGADSSCGGVGGVVIGASVTSFADGATALGKGSSASGDSSLAAGGAEATGNRGISLGAAASSTGVDSLAVGQEASAAGENSIAFGRRASSIGNSMAIGKNSKANAPQATVVGELAEASYPQSLAVGVKAKAAKSYGVALGAFANATVKGGFSVAAMSYVPAAPDLTGDYGPPANATRQSAMQTVSATAPLDLTDGAATVELSFPPDTLLMADAFDIIVVEAAGAGGSPEIKIGPDGSESAAYLAATAVGKTVVGARETHAPLNIDGVTSLLVSVASPGIGTAYKAKVVVRGYVMEM